MRTQAHVPSLHPSFLHDVPVGLCPCLYPNMFGCLSVGYKWFRSQIKYYLVMMASLKSTIEGEGLWDSGE